MTTNDSIARATGLLVIEVRNSNPNGDPDRESDPRQRSHDGRGYVTGVSLKRKMRDLVEQKDGEVWQHLKTQLSLNDDDFSVLESRERGFTDVNEAAEAWRKVVELIGQDHKDVANKYWDARTFGATFLEKGEDAPKGAAQKSGGDRKYIRTGVAHFPNGVSVAPVRVLRDTLTKKASAQESKDRGMAPLASRVVEHGVYCMPFFVNPTAARRSGCTAKDIALMLALIRYAYSHTRSVARSMIEVRHAWYAEHENEPGTQYSLGSFSEFEFIESMTPKRKWIPKNADDKMSSSTDQVPLAEQYDVPLDLPKNFLGKLKNGTLYDLCVELPDWCKARS